MEEIYKSLFDIFERRCSLREQDSQGAELAEPGSMNQWIERLGLFLGKLHITRNFEGYESKKKTRATI